MKTHDYLTTSGIHFRRVVLSVLLTMSFTALHAQLSGTKTIGPGGNYPSFTAAVATLTSQGVSGPVTFNVLNGTYYEQIEIDSIAGASDVNMITFQAQSGNPADVTLTFTPSDTNNYVVRLVQADYVTFQNMTLDASSGTVYGTVVKLDGDADNNRFLNNVITGVSTTSNSENLILFHADDDSSDNTTIIGNTLINGSYGVALASTNPVFSSGTQVIDNVFTNQGNKGISLFYHNGAHVNGNTISSNTLNVSVGIEVTRCDSALEILRNKITIPNSGYGINLYACSGSAGNPGVTANNFITSLHGNSTGLWLSSCTYQDIYYNSVNITNESFEGQALWVDGTAAHNNIVNNIFANEGGGYCFTAYPPATGEIAISNYNNLYTTGNRVAYWEGSDIVDLAAFRSVSGRETNSISLNPSFYSSTNLHVYVPDLDSTGTPLAAVTTDIDGDLRDPSRPDIGADEFAIVQMEFNEGWNMVSVPVIAGSFQRTALFPGATSNVFSYTGGTYRPNDTLSNGIGYWINYAGDTYDTLVGSPIAEDTIDLTTGWNLIGSISVPVPVSQIVSIPGGLITSQFFGYSTSYEIAATIEPGKAYWVQVIGNGSLVLSSSGSVSLANRIRIVPCTEIPPPPPGGITHTRKNQPTKFSLEDAYPNPFNPSTTIEFGLVTSGLTSLKVYDVLGREVAILVNEQLEPGTYRRVWDASAMTNGVYYYRLVVTNRSGTSGTFIDTKKLLLVK